ncbi:MAG: 23S rRNA (adenine(2030)-N(6))-methyltransferase RlmJ [Parvularculaceae bacterium]|nr:23S rRNA (adenine(2030)-N(6))-methyltransferase RlmJ [Parvularculaceae bacterium]
MNYRHAFHAGNHCDVLKHAALCLVLERLKAKEKPFAVLDTHAGRGLYDLTGEAALKTAEHQGGIARVLADPLPPAALQPYLHAVARANPFGGLRWYPGSPQIVVDALRRGDSAKFCELHPEERAALEAAIGADSQVKIFDRDGYQAVRAFLPPVERRGLVLIDPPFEQPGEYVRLAEALSDGLKRWATGVFMLWRPVKDATGWRVFLRAAEGMGDTLNVELNIRGPVDDKLTGSGLFIVNPPFGVSANLAEVLPWLAERLAIGPGAGWSLVEREGGVSIREEKGGAAQALPI